MLLAVDVGNSNIAVGVFRFTDARTPEIVCHFKLGAHNYAPDVTLLVETNGVYADTARLRSRPPLFRRLFRI